MRRLLVITGAAFCAGVVLLSPASASAAPTTVCSVSDERLPKISGITAVNGGYLVVDNNGDAQQLRLYRLDGTCKATRVLNDANIDPFSPQDLARTPDGVVWVADVGDVAKERATVAVHKVPAGASRGVKFRLTYPDGKHDSAALIMQPNGIPVIITKEPANVAKLYTTAAPLPAAATTVPLQAAGTVTIPPSTTSGGPVGPAGRIVVTGAALSPDAKKVLLRTYTDAYEWDVPDGNVAAALKSGKPRHTPLPDEQSGEAITYTADGAGYVTVSATTPSPLQEWTPAPPPKPAGAAKSTGAKESDGGFSITDLSLKQLGAVVIGVGVLGLLMLVAGIIGIVRFRRQIAEDPDGARAGSDRKRPGDANPATANAAEPEPETVMFPKVGGTVYGSGAAAPTSPAPAPPAPGAPGGRGTVYGGSSGAADRGGAAGRGGADDGAGRATVYGAPGRAAGGNRDTARGEPEPASSPRGTVYGGTTYGSSPGRGSGAGSGADASRGRASNGDPGSSGGRGGSARGAAGGAPPSQPGGGSGRSAAGRGAAPASGSAGVGSAGVGSAGVGSAGVAGAGSGRAGSGGAGGASRGSASGGTVYGARRDPVSAPEAPDDTQQWSPPRRPQRDWRSREPRD